VPIEHTGKIRLTFWMEDLEERSHLADFRIYESIILKWNVEKYAAKVWIGFIWLRIRTSGGLL
jgi:hypothetical protein